MLKYGLKLWSSNSEVVIKEAVALVEQKRFDFVELYHNANEPVDYQKFALLKSLLVTIHHTNTGPWHEFIIGEEEMKVWQETVKMADFFGSSLIVVHPGRTHNVESFAYELKKINEPRIFIENMAGLDRENRPMFAATLAELKEIKKLKPICFDFEKAVKSACREDLDYRQFILDCVRELKPTYFHISGGDKDSPVDEHKNLWEATFDVGWIRETLQDLARSQDISLVFETPKVGESLENDLHNLHNFNTTTPQH